MSDLISRQAAIDALCHIDEYNAKSVSAIKALPSAQPECEDCIKHGGNICPPCPKVPECENAVSRKWLVEAVEEGWIKFDTEKDYNRYIHMVRDITPSVTPKQPGWIPCSTEMPPTGKDVLVTLEGGTVTDGERWEPQEGKWFLFGGGVNGLDEDVIAWMPLPAPYRQEGDEKHGTPRSV